MIFVDTSFWVGLGVPRDGRNADARRLYEEFARGPLVTTNHVRGETWTFLRRRIGHWAGVDFLDRLGRAPNIRLVHVSDELEKAALRWLRRHDERPYSFVDATSFAVMKALRIRDALAFDGDFAAAGFRELRLQS